MVVGPCISEAADVIGEGMWKIGMESGRVGGGVPGWWAGVRWVTAFLPTGPLDTLVQGDRDRLLSDSASVKLHLALSATAQNVQFYRCYVLIEALRLPLTVGLDIPALVGPAG